MTSSANTIDFNINDFVFVRLTERGRKIHREYWMSVLSGDCLPIEEDADGWSRWQAWDLMHIFGAHLFLASHMPFETTIRIEVKP